MAFIVQEGPLSLTASHSPDCMGDLSRESPSFCEVWSPCQSPEIDSEPRLEKEAKDNPFTNDHFEEFSGDAQVKYLQIVTPRSKSESKSKV